MTRPLYERASVNVGLVIGSSMSRAAAKPWGNAVFPAPRSPTRRTRSPVLARLATCAASWRVASTEVVRYPAIARGDASGVKTDWNPVLRGEFEKPYWQELQRFVADERAKGAVYPEHDDVFAALHLTPYAEVRVL